MAQEDPAPKKGEEENGERSERVRDGARDGGQRPSVSPVGHQLPDRANLSLHCWCVPQVPTTTSVPVNTNDSDSTGGNFDQEEYEDFSAEEIEVTIDRSNRAQPESSALTFNTTMVYTPNTEMISSDGEESILSSDVESYDDQTDGSSFEEEEDYAATMPNTDAITANVSTNFYD